MGILNQLLRLRIVKYFSNLLRNTKFLNNLNKKKKFSYTGGNKVFYLRSISDIFSEKENDSKSEKSLVTQAGDLSEDEYFDALSNCSSDNTEYFELGKFYNSESLEEVEDCSINNPEDTFAIVIYSMQVNRKSNVNNKANKVKGYKLQKLGQKNKDEYQLVFENGGELFEVDFTNFKIYMPPYFQSKKNKVLTNVFQYDADNDRSSNELPGIVVLLKRPNVINFNPTYRGWTASLMSRAWNKIKDAIQSNPTTMLSYLFPVIAVSSESGSVNIQIREVKEILEAINKNNGKHSSKAKSVINCINSSSTFLNKISDVIKEVVPVGELIKFDIKDIIISGEMIGKLKEGRVSAGEVTLDEKASFAAFDLSKGKEKIREGVDSTPKTSINSSVISHKSRSEYDSLLKQRLLFDLKNLLDNVCILLN